MIKFIGRIMCMKESVITIDFTKLSDFIIHRKFSYMKYISRLIKYKAAVTDPARSAMKFYSKH